MSSDSIRIMFRKVLENIIQIIKHNIYSVSYILPQNRWVLSYSMT